MVLLEPCAASCESLPPLIVDEARVSTARREAEISVIDAQEQPMLRARREHPVRLEAPFGDQIVDQNAYVCLVATKLEHIASGDDVCSVHAGDETLGRGFFVPRRAVDLSSEEEASDALRLEAPRQFG